MHGRDAAARRHFIDITDLLVSQPNPQAERLLEPIA
jgi:hypothetical protein